MSTRKLYGTSASGCSKACGEWRRGGVEFDLLCTVQASHLSNVEIRRRAPSQSLTDAPPSSNENQRYKVNEARMSRSKVVFSIG
jgi:hypothetical protein